MLYLALLFALLWLLGAAVRDVYRRRVSRLPPGPLGLPLVGNVLQLPSTHLWLKLHSWSERYGPFYTIWVMGTPMVVIGDVKVAGDVLDRMSGITGGRPRSAKSEFYRVRSMFGQEDLGSHFRAGRRGLHASFNVRAVGKFSQVQSEEAAYLALGLLQYPTKSFSSHTHRLSGSTIFRVLYGGKSFEHMGEDPSRVVDKLAKEILYAMIPSNSRVDALPFLKPIVERVKWLRKPAEDWHRNAASEGFKLFDEADEHDPSSVVNDLRLNGEKYGLSKQNAVWATISVYMAGQESTHTALRVVVLALLHHPHVMRTAQQQLDDVCGSRVPSSGDREQLPYIEAIVKESLRWRSGAPLGVPHKAEEDFEYGGYIVRKGTTILDNIWSQTRDASVYPNPETFDPTRFLDATGNLRPSAPDTHLDLLGFGHGRRVCPGKDFATNGMILATATLLWAFDIDWPVDGQGNKIIRGVDPFKDFEDHSGLLGTPKPFEPVFTPRQEGLEAKLLEVFKASA